MADSVSKRRDKLRETLEGAKVHEDNAYEVMWAIEELIEAIVAEKIAEHVAYIHKETL